MERKISKENSCKKRPQPQGQQPKRRNNDSDGSKKWRDDKRESQKLEMSEVSHTPYTVAFELIRRFQRFFLIS